MAKKESIVCMECGKKLRDVDEVSDNIIEYCDKHQPPYLPRWNRNWPIDEDRS